ncbi:MULTISPECIES: hypothetical protein [unclassified Campylobacter]|uniref:hypothetical protein n=1 Tax=unclassified Campylobacter TaxID=2593542 RepID=UPI0022EA00A4|nr:MULTISPECIES: hypothetical protein [unclassified Campylobacter]MDA3055025.1 hypothetical protein [Campylobacter sp. VBCF_07 NA4]MDA3060527.1 hypothetical protein [Campylobacter sp. VBCF_02 NA5]MDA3070207.1 hypothetical protein [Campylobacter sp. VBCF_08 NA3]
MIKTLFRGFTKFAEAVVIGWLFLIGFILLLILLAYLWYKISSSYGDFMSVKKHNSAEISKLFSTENPKSLLLYRSKTSYGKVCYVNFLKLESDFVFTEEFIAKNGFEKVSETKCHSIANLTGASTKFAAPNFTYLNHKEFLVWGSTENLHISALNDNMGQVWRDGRDEHEIIFYPDKNIVQKNTLQPYR